MRRSYWISPKDFSSLNLLRIFLKCLLVLTEDYLSIKKCIFTVIVASLFCDSSSLAVYTANFDSTSDNLLFIDFHSSLKEQK